MISPPSEGFTPFHPLPLTKGVKLCLCLKSKMLGFIKMDFTVPWHHLFLPPGVLMPWAVSFWAMALRVATLNHTASYN